MVKKYWIIVVIAFTFSCASSKFIEPLEKKQSAISLDIGGPLIDFNGATIPVPLSSINYGYGLKENLSVFSSLHLTSLVFNNFHSEIGVLKKIYFQNKFIPSVSSSFSLNFITELSLGNSKIWPQIESNAFWKIGKNRLHLGGLIMIDSEIVNTDVAYLINPHIGYTKSFNKINVGVEVKFLAPLNDNTKVFLPYNSLTGDYGATGVYLNFTKRF
ncbi:MAG: hypothetical protein ACON4Y_01340 [Flavobacteriales bacterium]